jgi:hypothetical protein
MEDLEAGVDAPRQLQEFAPLSYILNRIPTKAQKGFSTIKIELISIDVTKEYVALGSNIGLIFMFDRKKEILQRLNCDVRLECHLFYLNPSADNR